MGKKGSWLRSVKKAMGSEPKEQSDQKPSKSKKKWFGKKKASDPIPSEVEAVEETARSAPPPPPQPPSTTTTSSSTSAPAITTLQPVALPPRPPLPQESVKAKEEVEEMQRQHTSSLAIATAKAAEAAMAAAQAAVELARLTNATRFPGKSKEEVAIIRLQTAFRGYLARRALRVLRGLERMKGVMQGQSVKRQTANALKCMQALVRIQNEIHTRRLRTSEENLARQKQLLDKHAKEIEKIQHNQKNVDDWNTSAKSKEQIQTRLQNKHEASIKRERALAYSFNHQRTWRNSTTTKPAQTMFMENINPHWGWSWIERWLDARPWENASPGNPDLAPLRSSLHTTPSGSQIAKALLYHVTEKPQSATSSPRSIRSAASPRIANTTSTTIQRQRISTGRLSTSSTPRARPKTTSSSRASPRKTKTRDDQDDAKSVASMVSEQGRRRSVAGSVDNESLASSPAGLGGVSVPSYMASTESARAKSRMGSPSSTDRMSVCSGKRRVSYTSSPARSRMSTSSMTDEA